MPATAGGPRGKCARPNRPPIVPRSRSRDSGRPDRGRRGRRPSCSLLVEQPATSTARNHGSTKNNGVSTATPKPGGSLTFAVEAEEQGFDPASARYDATGIIYARTVFDPLTTVAADGTIQPYLAQAVTPNADYSRVDHHDAAERGLPRRHPLRRGGR